MAASMGYAIQLGMGTSAVDELYEYKSGDFGLIEEFYDARGISGSRSRISERVRRNTRKASGTLTLEPNVAELATLLPRILGAAASGTTFALAETLPTFYVGLDKGMKVFTYNGCVVNKATFKGESGRPLSLDLEIEGLDETVGNSGTFPSLSLNKATGPLMFSDAVISVGGSNYGFKSFELSIDNALDTERFLNNVTRQSLPPKDRTITCKLNGPYGDNSAIYAPALGGVAVVATFTNADANTVSLVFSMVKVQFPRITPKAAELNEIDLPLEGIARMSGSTRELVTTLDSTV